MNVFSLSFRDGWVYTVCMFFFFICSFEENLYDCINVYTLGCFPNIIPMNLILLEALAGIFGGGNFVLRALLYLVINDVTPPARR